MTSLTSNLFNRYTTVGLQKDAMQATVQKDCRSKLVKTSFLQCVYTSHSRVLPNRTSRGRV